MPENVRFITVVLGIAVSPKGRILMTQRHAPDHPEVHNKWQFPGGGVEFGEQPTQTLQRELKEELNIPMVDLRQPEPIVTTSVWLKKVGGHKIDTHATLIGYLVNLDEDSSISLDLETANWGWFSIEQAKALDSLPNTITFILAAERSLLEKP